MAGKPACCRFCAAWAAAGTARGVHTAARGVHTAACGGRTAAGCNAAAAAAAVAVAVHHDLRQTQAYRCHTTLLLPSCCCRCRWLRLAGATKQNLRARSLSLPCHCHHGFLINMLMQMSYYFWQHFKFVGWNSPHHSICLAAVESLGGVFALKGLSCMLCPICMALHSLPAGTKQSSAALVILYLAPSCFNDVGRPYYTDSRQVLCTPGPQAHRCGWPFGSREHEIEQEKPGVKLWSF
eukprot:1141024-Pelagomonas_calceolata.AAC.6